MRVLFIDSDGVIADPVRYGPGVGLGLKLALDG
jgi:hypothetical protein